MLILNRRTGEHIKIGEDIEVKIVSVDGNKVRLGITAPKSTVVDREEVFKRKLRERLQQDKS